MPNPLRFFVQELRLLNFLAEYWPFLLLLWIVVAFVLGIVVGRFIRFGTGDDS
jgi:hypothetical protein